MLNDPRDVTRKDGIGNIYRVAARDLDDATNTVHSVLVHLQALLQDGSPAGEADRMAVRTLVGTLQQAMSLTDRAARYSRKVAVAPPLSNRYGDPVADAGVAIKWNGGKY